MNLSLVDPTQHLRRSQGETGDHARGLQGSASCTGHPVKYTGESWEPTRSQSRNTNLEQKERNKRKLSGESRIPQTGKGLIKCVPSFKEAPEDATQAFPADSHLAFRPHSSTEHQRTHCHLPPVWSLQLGDRCFISQLYRTTGGKKFLAETAKTQFHLHLLR